MWSFRPLQRDLHTNWTPLVLTPRRAIFQNVLCFFFHSPRETKTSLKMYSYRGVAIAKRFVVRLKKKKMANRCDQNCRETQREILLKSFAGRGSWTAVFAIFGCFATHLLSVKFWKKFWKPTSSYVGYVGDFVLSKLIFVLSALADVVRRYVFQTWRTSKQYYMDGKLFWQLKTYG